MKTAARRPSQKAVRGMRLLVVSEDPIVRDLLLTIGEKHGLRVSATADPDEAAAGIDSAGTAIAIVDPRAWGDDGRAIVGRLCADARGIKVMVVVDRAGPLIPAEIKKAGAIALLPYPLEARGLDTVLELLGHSAGKA